MASPLRLSPEQAWNKIQSYCAYQERSHRQVKEKLYSYGLHRGEVDELLTRLIGEGFLNEERFARAFAGGKFRMKQWGRFKIERALQALDVSSVCISRGLREIDPADYRATLVRLLQKKKKSLSPAAPLALRQKLAAYAIGKGYEPELVWPVVNDLVPAK